MLTKYPLVYKFSARAGTDLDLKTKVCPSFFYAQFFFFRQWGVESAGFYLHSAPRLEQARKAWVAGSNMHRETGRDLEFKQNKHCVFNSRSNWASDRAIASCERRLGNQNFAEISCLFLFGFCIISGEREESYAKNGKKYTSSTSFVKSVSTC